MLFRSTPWSGSRASRSFSLWWSPSYSSLEPSTDQHHHQQSDKQHTEQGGTRPKQTPTVQQLAIPTIFLAHIEILESFNDKRPPTRSGRCQVDVVWKCLVQWVWTGQIGLLAEALIFGNRRPIVIPNIYQVGVFRYQIPVLDLLHIASTQRPVP